MIRESNHVLGDLARPELDDTTVTAMFAQRALLDAALAELKRAGVDSKQILVQGDEPEAAELGTDEVRSGRGGLAGLIFGAVVGGALGALIAVLWQTTALIQQIGVLGMIVAGAVVGVGVGLLFGSYRGMARQHQEVHESTPRHRKPPPLRISVKLPHDTPTAPTEQILSRHGASEVANHRPSLTA